MTKTLIEKLEGRRFHLTGNDSYALGQNDMLADIVELVREHEAEQPKTPYRVSTTGPIPPCRFCASTGDRGYVKRNQVWRYFCAHCKADVQESPPQQAYPSQTYMVSSATRMPPGRTHESEQTGALLSVHTAPSDLTDAEMISLTAGASEPEDHGMKRVYPAETAALHQSMAAAVTETDGWSAEKRKVMGMAPKAEQPKASGQPDEYAAFQNALKNWNGPDDECNQYHADEGALYWLWGKAVEWAKSPKREPSEQPKASAEVVERVARAIRNTTIGVYKGQSGALLSYEKAEVAAVAAIAAIGNGSAIPPVAAYSAKIVSVTLKSGLFHLKEPYEPKPGEMLTLDLSDDGTATVVAESDPQLTPAAQMPHGNIEDVLFSVIGKHGVDAVAASMSRIESGLRCNQETRPSGSQGGDIYPSVVVTGAGDAYRRATEAVKDMVVAHHMSHAPACDSSHWKDVFEDASTAALTALPAMMPAPVSLTEEEKREAVEVMYVEHRKYCRLQSVDAPHPMEAAMSALLERFELRRREP